MRVVRQNVVLAESNDTIIIEGNHYFPPDSINWDYFQNSNTHTTCPWKGEASNYNFVIRDKVDEDNHRMVDVETREFEYQVKRFLETL